MNFSGDLGMVSGREYPQISAGKVYFLHLVSVDSFVFVLLSVSSFSFSFLSVG